MSKDGTFKSILLFLTVLVCLSLGQVRVVFASTNQCQKIFSKKVGNTVISGPSRESDTWSDKAEGPPQGELTFVSRLKRSSQPSGIYKDQAGEQWLLKEDIKHSELQTSAEVISAAIYRHFGYKAPETYIVKMNGRRYSASRYYRGAKPFDFQNQLPNTRENRALRVVSAYLKDWDRSTNGNTIQLSDGNILFLDFGGTLGARAQGEFKPGEVFSEAVGAFVAPDSAYAYKSSRIYRPDGDFDGEHPLKELYDGFSIEKLPSDHPWKKMTVKDIAETIELFRTLDMQTIDAIVSQAQFSSLRDFYQMRSSLLIRRDVFLEYLEEYMGGDVLAKGSYWAKKAPEDPLTFEVMTNRENPNRISKDVKDFVSHLELSSQEVVLFRGQEALTEALLAPGYRGDNGEKRPLPSRERRQEILREITMAQHQRLNLAREEERKYVYGAGGSFADIRWWDRATALDLVAEKHSTSDGLGLFVSTTRSLDVASRWIKEGRFQALYRYVYILSVPSKETIPITKSFYGRDQSHNREAEYVIPFDATPYIRGIYDTVENKFIDL